MPSPKPFARSNITPPGSPPAASLGPRLLTRRRSLLEGGALALSAVTPGWAASGRLKVGVAEIPITPSWSTSLWGYDNKVRYTSGVRDDIFAKAFLFESGRRFLLITLDVGAMGFALTRRIVAGIRNVVDIPQDAVAIQCTHNHSAPALLDIPTTPADEKFQRFLEDKLVMAAQRAQSNLSEAVLEFGHTDSSIALNRRVGNRKNTWDKDSGPIDSALNVLLARSSAGRNLGVVVNYPSHPVTLREDNEQISADFPGVLYSDLGRSLNCPVSYVQGCCGDMIPKVFGTPKEMEEYGKKLAEEARKALAAAKPVSGDSIEFRARRVLLTYLAPYTLEEIRARYNEFSSRQHWIQEWARRYLRYLEDGGDIRQHHDTLVQALRIGDVAIAFLPGEILHLTGLLIRKEFPGRKLIVAAYANDTSVGYLPHADEFPKGSYEVDDAWKYYGTLKTTPEMERTVREAAIALLRAVSP